MFLKIAISLLSLCLFAPFAMAQKSVPGKTSSPPSENKKLPPSKDEEKDENMRKLKMAGRHQQALLMLKGVVAEAQKLDDSIMKVRTLAQAADALWEDDQTQARRLFTNAFEAIGLINSYKSKDLSRQTPDGDFGKLFQLRYGLLHLIAQRDAKLAEELRNKLEDTTKDESKSSKTTPSSQKDLNAPPSEKEMLDWSMVIGSAKTQPEQTARFVNSYLPNGISSMLANGLIGIRHQNPALADQLFNNAVQAARVSPNATGNFTILAGYILRDHHNMSSEEEQRRKAVVSFLGCVVEAIAIQAAAGPPMTTQARENREEYSMLQGLLPFFKLTMPDKTPIIEGRMMALRMSFDVTQNKPTRTADDWVQASEKLSGGRERDSAYMEASNAALREGDVDRAISLAEKIDDEGARRLQYSLALHRASLKSLDTGNIEEAHRLARGIELAGVRIETFLKMTDKLRANKELGRAQEILEEIWEWANKSDNNGNKAQALLVLTATMTKQDAEKGFEYLRSTVKTIDQIDFSLPVLTSKIFKMNPFTIDTLDFNGAFSLLSRIDFERTVRIARTFNNKEVSFFTQVIACQQELLSTSKGVLPSNSTNK
jgi:hypothetical protein